MPPSPVEIVFVAANDQMPASPQVPARRPCHDAPCACAQSSSRTMPSSRQNAAICSTSKAMWPPMWTSTAARGLCSLRLALEVVERHAEVVAVAVDELHLRARRLQRERRRHERVRRAEHRLAAQLEELERGERRAGPARRRERRQRRSTSAQASSKARVSGPSDHCSLSIASSQSACRRSRSRWSNPMAKASMFKAVVVPSRSRPRWGAAQP